MEPYYPCTWLSLVNQKNEKNKKLKFVKKIIYTVPEVYLFIYLFNNIYTGSKYQLQKLFFLQSPV